jgi:transposase
MTEIQSARSAPVLVGIDIAKNRHEVLIEVPGRKRRRRVTMLNTRADFDRLTALLLEHDRPVRVAFEATGNYHRALAWHLTRAGFETKLVSSVGVARTREALHNGWDKNDPKDAQVILHMLSIGADQFYHDPLVQGTNDIQELSKTHDMVSRSKTELWHRILTHYLPLYFPEADRFHRSSRSDWFLAFLERYPSPHFISAMSREAFIADAWNAIGRRVSKERLLSDIYDTSASSVGLPVGPDSDAIRMFRLVLAEGRGLIEQRNRIEARAVELLSDHPDYRLLCTIPPLGHANMPCRAVGDRSDQRADGSCGSGRSAPLRSPPAVPEVLRHGSGDHPVRHVPWSDQAVKIRQRATAADLLDGRPGRHHAARQQLPRQVRTLHRQGSAQRRSAAQGVHGNRRQDGPHGICDRQRR